MKKARAAFKKCIVCFIDFSPKIDDKSSPNVRNTIVGTKIDKKLFPGTPFLAKDRFLVDFWVPEGTQKSPKSYEGAGGMGFEARLFGRID